MKIMKILYYENLEQYGIQFFLCISQPFFTRF